MDGRKHLLFALALGLCSGCHNQPAPEFPNWAGHVVDAASAERTASSVDIERGEKTAENIRYGQNISESGIGGKVTEVEGEAQQGRRSV